MLFIYARSTPRANYFQLLFGLSVICAHPIYLSQFLQTREIFVDGLFSTFQRINNSKPIFFRINVRYHSVYFPFQNSASQCQSIGIMHMHVYSDISPTTFSVFTHRIVLCVHIALLSYIRYLCHIFTMQVNKRCRRKF